MSPDSPSDMPQRSQYGSRTRGNPIFKPGLLASVTVTLHIDSIKAIVPVQKKPKIKTSAIGTCAW